MQRCSQFPLSTAFDKASLCSYTIKSAWLRSPPHLCIHVAILCFPYQSPVLISSTFIAVSVFLLTINNRRWYEKEIGRFFWHIKKSVDS